MFNPNAPLQDPWVLHFCLESMPTTDDCDKDGRCWWGRPKDNMYNADWLYATIEEVKEYCDELMPSQWAAWYTFPQPTIPSYVNGDEDPACYNLDCEDEISNEEKNACDHYNERYVYPDWRD